MASVSLKFRKALGEVLNPTGQRRATRPSVDGKNLLLGFSGGIGSSILLDMIWSRYYSEPAENVVSPGSVGSRRRPSTWKTVKVAYVEQCAVHEDVRPKNNRFEFILIYNLFRGSIALE